MSAPEDRVYCDDPWCDGDHVVAGEQCGVDKDPPVGTEPPC